MLKNIDDANEKVGFAIKIHMETGPDNHGAAPRARAVCALAQVLLPALGRTRTQLCPGKMILKRAVVRFNNGEGRARTGWFLRQWRT